MCVGILTTITDTSTFTYRPAIVRTGASVCDIQMGLITETVAKAGLGGGTAIRLAGTLNEVRWGHVAIGPVTFASGQRVSSDDEAGEKKDK